VIVSADTSAELQQQAARAGVALLRKPVTDAMLAALVNDAMRTANRPAATAADAR
jgi:FixJ family two-component response regulator